MIFYKYPLKIYTYLINHGVNTSLVENMKIGVEQFFNLPIEEKKKKFRQTPNDIQQ
ncbi:non-heme dioxygenase in morphine synthesis amino-terminal protein [Medicago truncatula]|uniref:Non-heme dioxygenase in morphine synthesis amino-terminal protein n=1 Tax=Medicago truncatula TaxID=3880 RepID=G7JH31_MEDTR|nr:non-heme dioxygenase in morphine synthesis amino-terminal protein [Medicago truncatula]